MTGDHHGQSTERATLLVRGVDAILGTHKCWQQPCRARLLDRACPGGVFQAEIIPE